jgi:UDP-N-acetylmuramyl pentapeptide phosphotransferase/UDP-N-acetylglucosamine-1-phosphate transferase
MHPDPLIWILPIMAIFVGAISLIDDVRGVPAGLRFGVHLVGAAVPIWLGGFVQAFGPLAELSNGLGVPQWILAVLMGLWMVGYTNAFNFMDGINGIAGFQAGIGGLVMALMVGVGQGKWDSAPVLMSLAVSGAAFGFLPHNFPRARMFMGDVGSAPLGMVLAFLALWICREHGFHLFLPISLVFSNFILDTSITLVRRIRRGDAWLQPHREHFYQRLIRSGRSHVFVTGWETGLLVLSGVVGVGVSTAGWMAQVLAVGFVFLVWASFFGYAEASFRRAGLAGK